MHNHAIKNALKNRRLSKITISIGDENDDTNKDVGLAPETPDSKQHIDQGETPDQVREQLMHPEINEAGFEVDNIQSGDADYLSPELIAKSALGSDPSLNLNKKTLSGKAKEKMMAQMNKGKK